MNGNRAFRSFFNSKYIFKANNSNINSFNSFSNCMNNMYHQTMFKLITMSCIKSIQIQQLIRSNSISIVGDSLIDSKNSSINETALVQLIRSSQNIASLSLLRMLSGNFYIFNNYLNIYIRSDISTCMGVKPTNQSCLLAIRKLINSVCNLN